MNEEKFVLKHTYDIRKYPFVYSDEFDYGPFEGPVNVIKNLMKFFNSGDFALMHQGASMLRGLLKTNDDHTKCYRQFYDEMMKGINIMCDDIITELDERLGQHNVGDFDKYSWEIHRTRLRNDLFYHFALDSALREGSENYERIAEYKQSVENSMKHIAKLYEMKYKQ